MRVTIVLYNRGRQALHKLRLLPAGFDDRERDRQDGRTGDREIVHGQTQPREHPAREHARVPPIVVSCNMMPGRNQEVVAATKMVGALLAIVEEGEE